MIAYLYFWDQLEKASYFYDTVIARAIIANTTEAAYYDKPNRIKDSMQIFTDGGLWGSKYS